MLEMVDLKRSLNKKEYRAEIDKLEVRLGELQRRARELGIPIAVLFEGWEGAGKGTVMNRLLLALDSRGFTVHVIKPAGKEEAMWPYLGRFWQKLPAKGRIAIFDHSWYRGVLEERANGSVGKKLAARRFVGINAFERQLTDDGVVIVKIFLHISAREQAQRLKGLEANPLTAWRVTREDWRQNKHYDRYARAAEDVFSETGRVPWHVVEAHERRFAVVKVFTTVCGALERAVRRAPVSLPAASAAPEKISKLRKSVLSGVNLKLTVARKRYEHDLELLQQRLWELQHQAYMKRVPVVIAYEGWDAGGKGGNIRRVVQALDPRGYEVVPIGAPTETEKAHHYLWRFWNRFPKAGHITIFDRSWYGRVLVERVEGFCTEAQWRRAYAEINETEQQWVDEGAVVIKFWLQIDAAEQLKRFKEREVTENKKWKITKEDWRNRENWKRYLPAVDEMLFRTSTPHAPWTIIEANCKLHARLKALRTIADRLEHRLT